MGACCCCASKGVGINSFPGYNHTSEEHEPLSSSHHGTPSSSLSTGNLVNTNLDTSTPDTYISPPAPLPYDFNSRRPLTLSPTPGLDSGEINNVNNNNSEILDKNLKEGDCKVKTDCELALSSVVEFEDIDVLKKNSEPFVPVEEENGCPICLEDYDDENPKLLMKCEHHFHLACILEWMERRKACPVCDKIIIDPSLTR